MFWILVLLLLIAILAVPSWPYSRGWGYYPSGIAAALLIILLILALLAVIPVTWPWGAAAPVDPAG